MNLHLIVYCFSLLCTLSLFVDFAHAQNKELPKHIAVPPQLPRNIPPPPSFGGVASKNGRYQLISAEYYSQDAKPFLYKRLVKIDTTTGQAWILHSRGGPGKEVRTWVPLIEEG